MVVRRTKEEIKAGFPHKLKEQGVDFTIWLEEQKKQKVYEQEDLKSKKTTKENQLPKKEFPLKKNLKLKVFEEKEPENENKKEYVKIVEKIIIKDKNNEKQLKDLINEALDNCLWEWKRVPLDDTFKVEYLDKYGKEGWKMAFIYEPKLINSNSNKPNYICFQRPAKREQK
jgi:hypothetical protein